MEIQRIWLSTWINAWGRKSVSIPVIVVGGTALAPQPLLPNMELGTQKGCLMAVSTYHHHKWGGKTQTNPRQS